MNLRNIHNQEEDKTNPENQFSGHRANFEFQHKDNGFDKCK